MSDPSTSEKLERNMGARWVTPKEVARSLAGGGRPHKYSIQGSHLDGMGGGEAATNRDRLSIHVRRVRGGQEEGDRGNLLRGRAPPERVELAHLSNGSSGAGHVEHGLGHSSLGQSLLTSTAVCVSGQRLRTKGGMTGVLQGRSR